MYPDMQRPFICDPLPQLLTAAQKSSLRSNCPALTVEIPYNVEPITSNSAKSRRSSRHIFRHRICRWFHLVGL